jgi:hypothetical protein
MPVGSSLFTLWGEPHDSRAIVDEVRAPVLPGENAAVVRRTMSVETPRATVAGHPG